MALRRGLVAAVSVAVSLGGCAAEDDGDAADSGTQADTSADGSGDNLTGGEPTGECQESDVDVASLAAASGYSLVDLGSVATTEGIELLGESAFSGEAIGFCLPDDVVSFALYAVAETGGVSFERLDGPDGAWIDTSGPEIYLRSPARPSSLSTTSLASVHAPASGDLSAQAGRWLASAVTETSTNVEYKLAVRRGAPGSAFAVNLIFVDGNGLSESQVSTFVTSGAYFDALYGAVGLSGGDVGLGVITDSSLANISTTNDDILALANAPVEEDPMFGLVDGAIDLYVVAQAMKGDGAPVGGFASASPGNPDIPLASVVVIGTDNGTIAPGDMWNLVAHEIGHYLGLHHTTESTGESVEPLADTPECPIEFDADGDGSVQAWECTERDGRNMMFWQFENDVPFDPATPEQGFVMSHHPVLE